MPNRLKIIKIIHILLVLGMNSTQFQLIFSSKNLKNLRKSVTIQWHFFSALTCGVFVFSSVSARPPSPSRPPSSTLITPHSHSLTLTLTHSLSLSLTHSHSHSLTHTLTPHSHTHSLTQSLTHSLTHLPLTHTHSLTQSLTHSLTHSSHNLHCQGVGYTPWRPLGLRRFCVTGVGQYALHCQGVGYMPWRPLGLRRLCVAGVGQSALPRGWMYALTSLGAPRLLRGRRGTMYAAKGSDVRPCVPWGSASFTWQAWDNVHCQGVGCTPWRPLGLRRFRVAGVGQCALPRGWMYALVFFGFFGVPQISRNWTQISGFFLLCLHSYFFFVSFV